MEEFIFAAGSKVQKLLRNNFKKSFGDLRIDVLDNGGNPYRVFLRKGNNGGFDAIILCIDDDRERELGKVVRINNVDAVWFGSGLYDNLNDTSQKCYTGNTVLLIKGQTITIVSVNVTTFELNYPDEHVTRFVCTVGNSHIPSGWIETSHGIYTIKDINYEQGFIPKNNIPRNMELTCWIPNSHITPLSKFEKLM